MLWVFNMAMTPWKGQEASTIVFADVGNRVNAAGRWFRDQLRGSVSIPNISLNAAGKPIKGTRGSQPSAPGEYPRKVTGWLRKNIQSEYSRANLTSRVGTNVPYGKWLETGTSRMAARPWMSLGLRDFTAGIRTILQGKGGPSAVEVSPDDSFGGTPAGQVLSLQGKVFKTREALKDMGVPIKE
jgi:hypothetical protein